MSLQCWEDEACGERFLAGTTPDCCCWIPDSGRSWVGKENSGSLSHYACLLGQSRPAHTVKLGSQTFTKASMKLKREIKSLLKVLEGNINCKTKIYILHLKVLRVYWQNDRWVTKFGYYGDNELLFDDKRRGTHMHKDTSDSIQLLYERSVSRQVSEVLINR